MSQIIIKLFEKCLSPDNILRRQGEKELFDYSSKNYYQTLTDCCTLIISNESPSNIRQFSGTFLKYMFSNDIYISLWNNLSKENIELIKTNLMASLASEKQDIRQTSSLAIAAMARIEIPKGWKVIEVLYNTSHNENDNYRITSLITFKNIVDFMGVRLKQEEISIILGAFIDNMDIKLKQDVINQAVLGISSVIPLIEINFQNEKQREYILNSLNNLMDANYINQSRFNLNTENIQKNVLITYIKIIKNFAKYIINSFNKIADITIRYFNCNNQILSTLSIEVWCTLCESELELNKNILTSNYQDTLNDNIIRIIQERDTHSFNLGEEWCSTKAAVALITLLVMTKNKKVLERMLTYISECLNNDLLQKSEINFNSLSNQEKIKSLIIKQNAFLVYQGILYSKDLDQEIIMSSLQKIISELKNINSFAIIEPIGKCLIIICKVHFQIINDSKKIFEQFLEQIIQLMEFHINNKEIEFYLLLSMKHILINSNPEYYNKYLSIIIDILMKIAYSPKSYDKDRNLLVLSMFLTGKIIEICEDTKDNRNIIQIFFSKLYSSFQEALNMKAFNDLQEQQCYQDCIISIISTCCTYQKIAMNATQIKCVFDLISETIKQRNGLFPEAICALGSFSYFGWELFSNINDQVMNYVLLSLEDKDNFELCYQGLLAADDIITAVGSENIILIPKIVEKMQKIIKDPEIPRGLKIKCFPLYHDIFMIQDKCIGEYLGEVMQLLVDGMSTSIQPPNKETDKDTLEYLSEFREKIVELLTGVFMFLTDHNQTNVFSQYIDGFIKYLSKIVEPEFNPNMTLISEVGGILGDLYTHFKGAMDLYLNKNSLKIILEKLEQSQNPDHKEILLYIQQVFSDFINNYY